MNTPPPRVCVCVCLHSITTPNLVTEPLLHTHSGKHLHARRAACWTFRAANQVISWAVASVGRTRMEGECMSHTCWSRQTTRREHAFIPRSQAGPLNVPVAMATRLRAPLLLLQHLNKIEAIYRATRERHRLQTETRRRHTHMMPHLEFFSCVDFCLQKKKVAHVSIPPPPPFDPSPAYLVS